MTKRTTPRNAAPKPRRARAAAGTATPPLLVVVHPGSACGSADFHLGSFDAEAARIEIALDLRTWRGGVLVIDGELSDEVSAHPDLEDAIGQALRRAAAQGLIAERVWGCALLLNPDQGTAVREFIRRRGLPRRTEIRLTGAWAGKDGCVTDVERAFRRAGFSARILLSAIEEEPA